MRAFLAFLLCLAVAFQGVANAHAFKQPCPMEEGMDVVAMDVVAMDAASAADDCCNDADTAGRSGEPCKSGQECGVAHAFMLVSHQLAARAPASCLIAPIAELAPPSFDPSAVWRPPTTS